MGKAGYVASLWSASSFSSTYVREWNSIFLHALLAGGSLQRISQPPVTQTQLSMTPSHLISSRPQCYLFFCGWVEVFTESDVTPHQLLRSPHSPQTQLIYQRVPDMARIQLQSDRLNEMKPLVRRRNSE